MLSTGHIIKNRDIIDIRNKKRGLMPVKNLEKKSDIEYTEASGAFFRFARRRLKPDLFLCSEGLYICFR